jgi:hypothetical protein
MQNGGAAGEEAPVLSQHLHEHAQPEPVGRDSSSWCIEAAHPDKKGNEGQVCMFFPFFHKRRQPQEAIEAQREGGNRESKQPQTKAFP